MDNNGSAGAPAIALGSQALSHPPPGPCLLPPASWSTPRPGYELAKRVLDVTIALLVLALGAPLWALITLLVRLTSPGPALYCQRRVVGKGGREFTVYKFRTMYHNNDDALHKHAIARFLDGQPLDVVERNGVRVPVYKLTHDPRVTRLGRILRKTGLDEVPQFLNVVRGDMSVVGPRQPIYYEYERYDERQRHRLDVLPGITGLYQVTARSQVTFAEMIEIDLEYVHRRSFWLDLKIIALTPWVMLTGRGAH
jgi:lipopolysaccharide/colanic/teichoic acid biosynthesis glycosyltransferase